ncbi:MAG: formylglycine-generating enzyme family protein [Myxococcota bacterium]|nr:formylglycine-generating enzyme family protein [Myxococcota bacterium]
MTTVHEQWKKDAERWRVECKKSQHQKDHWLQIRKDLMGDNAMSAIRQLKEKGWTHALTEIFDVGSDNIIRWKGRTAPPLDIQNVFYSSLQAFPRGHLFHRIFESGGLKACWLLRYEQIAFGDLSESDRKRLLDVSIEMIPFQMDSCMIGNNNPESSSYPRHEISLKPFQLARYAVTQALYEWVMDKNPSRHIGASRPVEHISWYDSLRFCNALSEKKGLTPCYQLGEYTEDRDGFEVTEVSWNRAANGFRLPLEQEWEAAARHKNNLDFAGATNPTDVGWFRENSQQRTHAVMQKNGAPSGLYDLNGNVDEWCWNLAEPYEGVASDAPNPPREELIRPKMTPEALDKENQRRALLGIPPLIFHGESKEDAVDIEEPTVVVERVNRGGGWFDPADESPLYRRGSFYPTVRDGNLGLRIAQNLQP